MASITLFLLQPRSLSVWSSPEIIVLFILGGGMDSELCGCRAWVSLEAVD